ncbi:MAG: kinase [Rhodobacteraceae bacterium]|nr:MAG: kinase [Paracoccaceae bacterium]
MSFDSDPTKLHVACFGAACWDVIARPRAGGRGADVPGSVETRPGGVALNVALALAAAGLRVSLIGAVGDDDEGRLLAARLRAAGVGVDGLMTYEGAATGRYVAMERVDGDLLAAVHDASALDAMAPEHLPLAGLPPATAWFVDANLPAPVLKALAAAPDRPPLMADAVSVAKAAKLRPHLGQIATLYCNRSEAEAICATGLNAARAAAEALVRRGAARAVVTDGPQAAADAGPHAAVTLRPAAGALRSATGAGDALIAAHLAAHLGGARPEEALAAGLAAAGAHAGVEPVAVRARA